MQKKPDEHCFNCGHLKSKHRVPGDGECVICDCRKYRPPPKRKG